LPCKTCKANIGAASQRKMPPALEFPAGAPMFPARTESAYNGDSSVAVATRDDFRGRSGFDVGYKAVRACRGLVTS